MAQEISFVMAITKVFGRKPGQSLVDFNNELKALTQKDRDDISACLLAEHDLLVKDPLKPEVRS